MKRIIISSLVLVLLVTLAVGCSKKESGVLRVGTDPNYAPMEYQENGKIVGFDMDLIEAIAKEMGKEKVEYTAVDWDGIIPGLLNGNYDCLISAMTATDERKAQLNFSEPYFGAGQLILVRKNETRIQSEKDLDGKSVGVQGNTTADLWLTENMKGVRVLRFKANPEAVQDLKNGGADAVVADNAIIMWEAVKDPSLKVVSYTPFTVEQYGIGVKKGNDQLLDEINAALNRLKENGKYDEIFDKWFRAE